VPVGLTIENKQISGVTADPTRHGMQVTSRLNSVTENDIQPGSIVGLPLNDFFIRTASLPRMDKKQLQEAINLQISFHLPYDAASAYVTHQLKKRKKDQALLIVSTPKIALTKIKGIFPIPLALAGLALQLDKLKQDQSTLLVCISDNDIHTLTLQGFDIVFMRTFPRGNLENSNIKNLVRDLRLSWQEVYYQEERRSITPNKTIVFCSDNIEINYPAASGRGMTPKETDCDVHAGQQNGELNPLVGLKEAMEPRFFGEVDIVPQSEWLTTSDSRMANDSLFIPCGLAALKKHYKKFKSWNVIHTEPDYAQSLKRCALVTLPIWPLFFLLYYYADIHYLNMKMDGVEGKKRALAPKYREVIGVEENVTIMEDFLRDSGLGIHTPKVWFDLLSLLESKRPSNLSLNTISGKAYNVCIANGKAKSYSKVTKFIKSLEDSGKFDDLTLIYTQKSDKDVDFQISMRLHNENEVEEDEEEKDF